MTPHLRFHALLFPVVLLTWIATAFLIEGSEPSWAEPLWIRWLRKAAEHPIRTPVALHLITVSFLSGPWCLIEGVARHRGVPPT